MDYYFDELACPVNVSLPGPVSAYTRGPSTGSQRLLAESIGDRNNWRPSVPTLPSMWRRVPIDPWNYLQLPDFSPLTEVPKLTVQYLDAPLGRSEITSVQSDAGGRRVLESADGTRLDMSLLGVYYLTVRATTASGLVVAASSNGIVVDTSGPQFLDLHYFRRSSNPATAATLQDENDYVYFYWNAEDPESGITQYEVTVVDEHGGVILPLQDVGRVTIWRANGLSLVENVTYYATVFATNGAGIRTSHGGPGAQPESPGLRYSTAIPILENSRIQTPDMNVTQKTLAGLQEETILLTTSTDVISIAWDGVAGSIDKISWMVGTEFDSSDILPPTYVGPATPGQGGHGWAEIRGQHLYYGENYNNTGGDGVLGGDLFDLVQIGKGEDETTVRDYIIQKLKLPEGTCNYHRLRIHAVSGAFTDLHSVVCIVDTGGGRSAIVQPIKGKLLIALDRSGVSSQERRRAVVDGFRVTLEAADVSTSVAVVIGVLSAEELSQTYAVSAGGNYQSYVRNPADSQHLTSRSLLGRRMSFTDFSFYAGILEGVTLSSPLALTLSFASGSVSRQGFVLALLFWDTVSGFWRQVDDTCNEDSYLDVRAGMLTATLCATHGAPDRVVGATTPRKVYFSEATQFIVAEIKPDFVNTAPAIALPAETQNAFEGAAVEVSIQVIDAEGDAVDVEIVTPPTRGSAVIKGNVLEYTPDCIACHSHTVTVSIRAREQPLHEGPPLISEQATVTIAIWARNRKPAMLVVDGSGLRGASDTDTYVIYSSGLVIPLPQFVAVDHQGPIRFSVSGTGGMVVASCQTDQPYVTTVAATTTVATTTEAVETDATADPCNTYRGEECYDHAECINAWIGDGNSCISWSCEAMSEHGEVWPEACTNKGCVWDADAFYCHTPGKLPRCERYDENVCPSSRCEVDEIVNYCKSKGTQTPCSRFFSEADCPGFCDYHTTPWSTCVEVGEPPACYGYQSANDCPSDRCQWQAWNFCEDFSDDGTQTITTTTEVATTTDVRSCAMLTGATAQSCSTTAGCAYDLDTDICADSNCSLAATNPDLRRWPSIDLSKVMDGNELNSYASDFTRATFDATFVPSGTGNAVVTVQATDEEGLATVLTLRFRIRDYPETTIVEAATEKQPTKQPTTTGPTTAAQSTQQPNITQSPEAREIPEAEATGMSTQIYIIVGVVVGFVVVSAIVVLIVLRRRGR